MSEGELRNLYIARLEAERNRLTAVLRGEVVESGDVEIIPHGGHVQRLGGVLVLRYRSLDDFRAAHGVFLGAAKIGDQTERDRLVAGCQATADWIERLLPRGEWLISAIDDAQIKAKVAELRRLFLPAE